MLTIIVMMTFILLIAGAIVVYVAFPHRGEDIPNAAWLGDAMSKAVDSLPTLDESETLRR
ncbi:conserved hypothetical protein [metagenome]|uniref:Uncharacterized protein n=1 Tax=metagenome TaxID=256318 RepID=A0A2P2CCY2_9ZZZZ